MDVLDRLIDLHKEATTEQSHFYTASVTNEAIEEIKRLRESIMSYKKLILQIKEAFT